MSSPPRSEEEIVTELECPDIIKYITTKIVTKKQDDFSVQRTVYRVNDLRDYQREIVKQAIENKHLIAALPTGSGKTAIGIAFIHCLLGKPYEDNPLGEKGVYITTSSRFLVIVPTTALMVQWKKMLRDNFVVNAEEYVNVMPYPSFVLKRESICGTTKGRRLLEQPQQPQQPFVIIVDEAHHLHGYVSDIMPKTQVREAYDECVESLGESVYTLLLTPETNPRVINSLPQYPIYRKIYSELKDVLAKYKLHIVHVELAESTKEMYDRLTAGIARAKEELEAGLTPEEEADLIATIKSAIIRRRVALSIDPNVINTTVDVYMKYLRDIKTIIFTETVGWTKYIEGGGAVTRIAKALEKEGVRVVALTSKKDLEKIPSGKWDVILSAYLLSEGIDIPDVKGVILSSYTASEINIVQRIGRALRKVGNSTAYIYFIVPKGTYLETFTYRMVARLSH